MSVANPITNNASNFESWGQRFSKNGEKADIDEIIDHYEFFKNSQLEEKKKLYNHTVKTAAVLTEGFIRQIEELGIRVVNAYLRVNNTTGVSSLIFVDEETLLSDQFDKAYEIADEIESRNKSDIFDIDYSFAAETENLNEAAIYCQGYLLKRTPNNEQATEA